MVRVVTDAQHERKRETDRLYPEPNREKYMEYNRVYNERHPETKATSRVSFFQKYLDYAKVYYHRKVEATCCSVRPTLGRPGRPGRPGKSATTEPETETGSCE
jgi:hypothetical protein